MSNVLRVTYPKTLKSWSANEFNVYTTTINASLDDFQSDHTERSVTDVRCAYCDLPVLWEYPHYSTKVCDIEVSSSYHDCQVRGKQTDFGACNPGTGSLAQMRTNFADFAAMGLTWVRTDINWKTVQPTSSPTFTWGNFDNFVQGAVENGINVLFILDYGNPWESGQSSQMYPPTDLAKFASYVTQVVARYSPRGVKNYEVWNEPNINSFWQPSPNPAAYTALLKVAYAAAKAVDPAVNVIAGGTTLQSVSEISSTHYSAPDFLTIMYANGAAGYFDAFNYHPYSFFRENPNVQLVIDKLRATMIANGDGDRKIWFTEYGTPTSGTSGQNYVGESEQALRLVTAINYARNNPFVGPTFFYNYKDSASAQPDREGYFGIIRADGSHKPAYDAIKTAIATPAP